jgi:hypothetical protein
MKIFKVAAIVVVVLMVVGLFVACDGKYTGFDESVAIESGGSVRWDLKSGHYDIDISSDDGITVEWIGGGVDEGYNSNGAVTEYHKRDVPVFESTTLKIYNPTGWFSNPTALVHVKIVKR